MRNLAALQFVKGEAGAPGYYPAAPHTLGEPPANHPAGGRSFPGVQPGTFIPSKRWAPCRSHFTPKLIVFPSPILVEISFILMGSRWVTKGFNAGRVVVRLRFLKTLFWHLGDGFVKKRCSGLNSVYPKIHIHPEPQNVILLGYRVFSDA